MSFSSHIKTAKPLLLSAGVYISASAAFSVAAFSQSLASEQPAPVKKNLVNDDSAQNNLAKDNLMSQLAKTTFFQADFEQKVFDEQGTELQAGKGKLAVKKPNLVNWHTLTPDESLIVSDGSTLWLFDPFIEQATAYDLSQSVTNTPILLLTNNDPKLWQHYKISQSADNSYSITALDNTAQVQKLELTFNGDQIRQFSLIDITGQLSEITLSNLDDKSAIDNKTFEFTVPEGVLLDDQR